MLKIAKKLWIIVLVLVLFCFGILLADKQYLEHEIIRMHIIANSDSIQDQEQKLIVRDALSDYLQCSMAGVKNAEQAHELLAEQLAVIKKVAQQVLCEQGNAQTVRVSLQDELFDTRTYDTFSLPAGKYRTLRVEIGEAEGKNWWCVAFPSLCQPATTESFEAVAAASGLDGGLASALSDNEEFSIRFFLLDCIGKVEKIFSFF